MYTKAAGVTGINDADEIILKIFLVHFVILGGTKLHHLIYKF